MALSCSFMFVYIGLMMTHSSGRNQLSDSKHSQNGELCLIESIDIDLRFTPTWVLHITKKNYISLMGYAVEKSIEEFR